MLRFVNSFAIIFCLIWPNVLSSQVILDANKIESVSLVYASAYSQNPASAFGHLFLVFNQQDRADYLKFTMSYSAQMNDDEDVLKYIFAGMGGGYFGEFSVSPLYLKVEEYINFENRDLWLYQLKLTQAEIKQLIDNIKKTVKNNDKYYFLNRNCAYKIYELLSMTRPSIEKFNKYQTKASPLDILKKIENQIGFEKIHMLPSLRRQYINAKNKIMDQRELFIVTSNLPVENLREKSNDFLIAKSIKYEYLNKYKHEVEYINDSQLLVEVSHRKISTQKFQFEEIEKSSTDPLLSHSDSRFELNISEKNKSIFALSYFSHRLLDITNGYELAQQIEFFRLDYLTDSKKMNIKFLDIEKLSSFSDPDWPFSYALNIGAADYIEATLAFGMSQQFKNNFIYLLPEINSEKNKFQYGLYTGLLAYTQHNLHFYIKSHILNLKNKYEFLLQKNMDQNFSLSLSYQYISDKVIQNESSAVSGSVYLHF